MPGALGMRPGRLAVFLIIIIAIGLLAEHYYPQMQGRENWNSQHVEKEYGGHHTHQRQIQSIGIEKPKTPEGIEEILETKQRHIAEDEDTAKIEPQATRAPSSWYMLIDKPGYYELTEDIIDCTYECGIYINASNVVLDGKGHIIDGVYSGSGKYGIYVDHATNITIRNTKIL